MKKALFAVLFVLIFSIVPSLFAQEIEEESEYYYVTTPIEKIYLHRDGYVIFYRKGVNQMAYTYIPSEWFTEPDGKGDMVLMGSGTTWPRLTIYYKSGEFSHVRLFVRRDHRHETWGVIPLNANIDENFQGVEEISLEY